MSCRGSELVVRREPRIWSAFFSAPDLRLAPSTGVRSQGGPNEWRRRHYHSSANMASAAVPGLDGVDFPEELRCPVCLDVFSEPLFLPCCHNLCRECVRGLIESRGGTAYGVHMFPCPECRYDVVVRSVDSLQRNLVLQQMVDRCKQGALAAQSSGAHGRGPEAPTCQDHADEALELKMFCDPCERPVCYKCMAYDHKNHTLLQLEDAWSRRKDAFLRNIEMLRTKTESVENFVEKLRVISERVETNASQRKHMVTEGCDALISVIQQRKKALLDEISREEDERRESLDQQMTSCTQELDKVKEVLDTAQELLEKGAPAKCLQTAKTLKDRVRGHAMDQLSLYPVTSEHLTPLDFDVSQYIDSLIRLDFQRGSPEPEVVEEESQRQSLAQRLPGFFKRKSRKVLFKGVGTQFELDPKTAHKYIRLSNNNSTMSYDPDSLPTRRTFDTPNRFSKHSIAVGDVSVSSGIHYWEVDVSRSIFYRVGVASDKFPRDHALGENETSWCVDRYLHEYSALHAGTVVQLSLPPVQNRVGVLLNYTGGTLSFYNPMKKEHIYTFHAKFQDPVRPAFDVGKGEVTVYTGLALPTYVCKGS
ncbi:hypothetical protein Bbelb_097050 [Branchiostoma belcheri]|nr:hypothetical protein Bbelb_097050 [Branchiostoma belcheri]